VPAAFELPACEATKRAAQLAGFQVSPLLMEPVAAALAYGFDTESDRVFWLVYDFGGGTFDAAVMQVRDKMIQVVNHGGDNHLGGKLIDWEIVDQLLVPAISSEFRLRDLRRGNPRWRDVIAKLKNAGEEAKIRVSRVETAPISIDFTNHDDQERLASFEYELRRSDVERLSQPFITRSLNICRRVLSERRLGPANIEKIVLVGGPTLMPWLREQLADANEGLGIPVEFRVDPLTIVARGAAVFATTQRLQTGPPEATKGEFTIHLEYTPAGPDPEPPVGGRVTAPAGESLAGATIEFINHGAQPRWSSGKVPISPDGTFLTNLFAEKGKPNTFAIELRDRAGNIRPTIPDHLTYKVIITITEIPLIHSIGVGLANGETRRYFERGQALPTRARRIHRAALHVRQGQAEDALRIPVVEGENLRRWDRNREIGTLIIGGHQIRRDIPVDTEIEVTVEIDESRLTRAK
ncbi:MAG: Hsp70 family protein, partial [Gemmatimonadetes bacterium]|nr:Hsp70 family protein [Gemmatimonadota bacterium]